MQPDASSRWRDRSAIAASIALHLCVLSLVATLAGVTFSTLQPDERTVAARRITIEHRPPPRRTSSRPARPRHGPTPPPRRRVAPEPQRDIAVTKPRPAGKPMVERRDANLALAVPAALPRPVTPTEPPATPEPTPSPSLPPAVTSVAARAAGIGNLGESWPARAMPGSIDALRAKFGHVTVRVEVDEDGHATAVTLIAADDLSQREAIVRAFLELRYIPATCNGLSCTTQLEVRT